MALNFDCLGCVLDALQTGEITVDEYEDICWFMEGEREPTTPCPSCGAMAYIFAIGTYAHCPDCGTYFFQEMVTGEWVPYARGLADKPGKREVK